MGARDGVTMTAYRDGPLLVRGDFTLAGPDGGEVPHRGRVVALCRCGKSRARPFCDGTHKLVGFTCEAEVQRSVEVIPKNDCELRAVGTKPS